MSSCESTPPGQRSTHASTVAVSRVRVDPFLRQGGSDRTRRWSSSSKRSNQPSPSSKSWSSDCSASSPPRLTILTANRKPDLVSTAPPSSLAAQNLRKSLLRNLAAYDQISKRIRDLPLSEGSYPGGSQDRLQRAMAAKATLYLTQKLGVLRTLGNVDEATRPSKKQVPKDLGVEGGIKSLKSLLGESEEVVQGQNAQLAVLLEYVVPHSSGELTRFAGRKLL